MDEQGPPRTQESTTSGPRQIRRDVENGVIGGVAAGFARHLGVDVVWIRLAFVLTTFLAGGLGIVVYLASWLIVPAGDVRPATATAAQDREERPGRGAAFWTGVGLVAIGGITLLDGVLDPLTARYGWISTGELILPLALIGLGILIYRSSRDDTVLPLPLRDVAATERRIEEWAEGLEERAEAWEERHEVRAADLRAARSRSRVAPLTFGAGLVTLGALWLLGSFGVSGITFGRTVSATLLVVGTGLVVGAFRGRGRGLVGAGLLLVPVVIVATLAPQVDGIVLTDGDVRERVERPATLAALPAEYEFGAGRTTIDLRGIDGEALAAAGRTTLLIEFGVGELIVLLPADVAVEVEATLGIGELAVGDVRVGGIGQERTVRLDGTSPDTGLLVLTVEQGIGSMTVTR